MLFYEWEDAESGLIEIIPLICTSAIWTSILCVLILNLLRVHCLVRVAAAVDC